MATAVDHWSTDKAGWEHPGLKCKRSQGRLTRQMFGDPRHHYSIAILSRICICKK